MANSSMMSLLIAALLAVQTWGQVADTVMVYSKGIYGINDVGKDVFDQLFKKDSVVRRECCQCEASHKDIYYLRISDVPPALSAYDVFLKTWADSPDNVLNTDFKLYSSTQGLDGDTDAWEYCDYNDANIGFPRDCGPSGRVFSQWNSLLRGPPGVPFGQPDVKFTIWQKQDVIIVGEIPEMCTATTTTTTTFAATTIAATTTVTTATTTVTTTTPRTTTTAAMKTTSIAATTTAAPTRTVSATASYCQRIYEQCGGKAWQGVTCCEEGTVCTRLHEHYEQCLPVDDVTCAGFHKQCGGGEGWTGPTTCCVDHQECTVVNAYYSECIASSISNKTGDIHV